MLISEFITDTNKATSSRDLVILWRDAMKKLGFDRLLFTLMMDHKTIARKAGHVAVLDYPLAWMEQYSGGHTEEIDPVHHHMFVTKGAFTWNSLRNFKNLSFSQKALLNGARHAGLYNGIGIPLRGPSGELAAVRAACSVTQLRQTTETLDYAELLCEQFYKVYLRLERKDEVVKTIRLTDRERQVLILCASGRSKQEIAIAIGVTPDTVKFHMKGIFGKLEVANQEGAVTKAKMMGLISERHSRNPSQEE